MGTEDDKSKTTTTTTTTTTTPADDIGAQLSAIVRGAVFELQTALQHEIGALRTSVGGVEEQMKQLRMRIDGSDPPPPDAPPISDELADLRKSDVALEEKIEERAGGGIFKEGREFLGSTRTFLGSKEVRSTMTFVLMAIAALTGLANMVRGEHVTGASAGQLKAPAAEVSTR